MRGAHVRPVDPERRLAEPLPGPHGGDLRRLRRGGVGLLRVAHLAASEHVDPRRIGAGRKQIVLGAEVHEGNGLRASAVHEHGLEVHPEPEDRVPHHVWFLDLEPEAVPQARRQQPQGGDIVLMDRILLRQALLHLALHGHRDVRPDLVVAQVPPQRPELHALVLLHHLVVHHARRQHGDEGAAEQEAAHARTDEHGGLEAVPWQQLVGAQRDLVGGPVERDHVLIHGPGVEEGDLPVRRGDARDVDPAGAGVRGPHPADDEPEASEHMGGPTDASEQVEHPEHQPRNFGHVDLHNVLQEAREANRPQQPHDPQRSSQLREADHAKALAGV
mmetsp:Transcript_6632/g.18444  ORF Transcript_6632/g.18444 Transcript_6632/m.18444 type:complete len:331 (+) Transcript_6632:1027-2019(+)